MEKWKMKKNQEEDENEKAEMAWNRNNCEL